MSGAPAAGIESAGSLFRLYIDFYMLSKESGLPNYFLCINAPSCNLSSAARIFSLRNTLPYNTTHEKQFEL
jgi:hypothetical protein